VAFVLKISLSALDYGARPTNGEGKVALVVRDRRLGQYPVSVIYAACQYFCENSWSAGLRTGSRSSTEISTGN
jgi:hypothetical protein